MLSVPSGGGILTRERYNEPWPNASLDHNLVSTKKKGGWATFVSVSPPLSPPASLLARSLVTHEENLVAET
jgi:hypothetical protein